MDGADVIVIGGIVGTWAAAFLADSGARVILVERDALASAASGSNSRLVSDLMLGRQPAIPGELAPDRFGQPPR